MGIKIDFLLFGTERVEAYPTESADFPEVSVIVMTYNHENYITKCLDSILMQKTNFDFEILIGEDKSSDNTRNICIDYAKKFSKKIRLFLHDRRNVIFLYGRQTGRYNFIYNLISAKGKYIAICEGDDYWIDELKLQKQYDYLEKNKDFSFCFHNAYLMNNENNIEERFYLSGNIKKIWYFDDLLLSNPAPTASVVLRSNALKTIPSWFMNTPMGDWPLILLCAQSGPSYCMPEAMSVYRHNSTGIWSSRKKIEQINAIISTYEIFEKEFGEQKIENIKKAKKNWIKKKHTIIKNNFINFFISKMRFFIVFAKNVFKKCYKS